MTSLSHVTALKRSVDNASRRASSRLRAWRTAETDARLLCLPRPGPYVWAQRVLSLLLKHARHLSAHQASMVGPPPVGADPVGPAARTARCACRVLRLGSRLSFASAAPQSPPLGCVVRTERPQKAACAAESTVCVRPLLRYDSRDPLPTAQCASIGRCEAAVGPAMIRLAQSGLACSD